MFRPLRFLKKWTDASESLTADGLQTQTPLDESQIRAVWIAVSWLVSYPEDGLFARLDTVRAVTAGLPEPVARELGDTVARIAHADPIAVAADYVETFDTRRRGCLYLTYFANGDTRKRGAALLAIKQAYRAAGLNVSDDELPDHLAYVLEFGAGHDLLVGMSIVLRHRAGVELLRLHLTEIDSPWAGALRALCLTLPPLDTDDISAVQKLAAEGVEEEQVGLAGYGDGSLDMPPMDMSPYLVPQPPAPGDRTRLPLHQLGGPES